MPCSGNTWRQAHYSGCQPQGPSLNPNRKPSSITSNCITSLLHVPTRLGKLPRQIWRVMVFVLAQPDLRQLQIWFGFHPEELYPYPLNLWVIHLSDALSATVPILNLLKYRWCQACLSSGSPEQFSFFQLLGRVCPSRGSAERLRFWTSLISS